MNTAANIAAGVSLTVVQDRSKAIASPIRRGHRSRAHCRRDASPVPRVRHVFCSDIFSMDGKDRWVVTAFGERLWIGKDFPCLVPVRNLRQVFHDRGSTELSSKSAPSTVASLVAAERHRCRGRPSHPSIVWASSGNPVAETDARMQRMAQHYPGRSRHRQLPPASISRDAS